MHVTNGNSMLTLPLKLLSQTQDLRLPSKKVKKQQLFLKDHAQTVNDLN
jgi:hypothetical protein